MQPGDWICTACGFVVCLMRNVARNSCSTLTVTLTILRIGEDEKYACVAILSQRGTKFAKAFTEESFLQKG